MRSPLPLVLCIAACQGAPADTSPFTTMSPSATSDALASTTGSSANTTGGSTSTSASASASGTNSTGTSASAESASTTVIWDVGSGQDVGDGKPVGCKGKIDFLFVISRYHGMAWFQTQLLDALPDFIDTITSKFADFDYHIMVVDADEYWGSSVCQEQCPKPGEAPCAFKEYPCYHTPTQCDTLIGAGVVFPAAGNASNKLCPIDGGRRYMVKGQTDLKNTFACAAQVGTSGAARMGQTLAAAVQPWMNDEGSCNDGFLREDALLMVTLITNNYDQEGGAPSSYEGTPATWAAAVRDAKHGDLDSVVVLGIIPTEGPGCEDIDRLCQMLELFPFALNRDSWADSYGKFFEEGAELVETACADFVPPG